MLDLHGIKHENVGSLLDSFIWENMKKGVSSVSIITGNSSTMKKIVSDIVDEYGFVVNENIGNSAELIINFI